MEGDPKESEFVKLALFSVLAVAAVVVIVTTRNIFVLNAPEVWNNCAGGNWVQIYMHETKLTEESASEEIKTHAGSDVVFEGTSLEPCGKGYVFHDPSGERYLVCEDGSISKYVRACKNESLYNKGKAAIGTFIGSSSSKGK